MDYVKLGRTGLDVSRICLGCMSYGGGNRGNHAWSLSHKNWVEDCLRCLSGRPWGTGSSNPSPSSGESAANFGGTIDETSFGAVVSSQHVGEIGHLEEAHAPAQ
jgi:hypothetical protein